MKKLKKFFKWISISIGALFLLVILIGIFGEETTESEDITSKGKISDKDVVKIYSDPEKYKGYEVELLGRVFTDPEKDDEATYFQMFEDSENSERNTVVKFDDPDVEIAMDDYVKISGIIFDVYEGENAFGGMVNAPMIQANQLEVVSYLDAVSPTVKETSVEEIVNQHGLELTVSKIQFAENQTRVFLKINNTTDSKANFYSSDLKLVIGNKQYEEEYINSETTGLDELPSELLSGIEAEGVVVFPKVDFEDSDIIEIIAELSSDNYDLNFTPYNYEIEL
ncbi:hypothetical protein [Exiguobacterium mexicanum]|uniref:hypothetical protein n=1 Tax=Exiguobacterium mexicanum TaxID=340146 RepID=UPI00384C7AFD